MKSIPGRIEESFAKALSSFLEGYSAPFKIIAAFSGGPDSTTLLLLLRQFQKKFSYDLSAAYINHGLRSPRECREEEEQVESICRASGIPLYIKHCDPGFLDYFSVKKGCGLEAAARRYRYHYFEKLSASWEGPVLLALGHNRNDQIETVLMRLFSGASMEGLKGIPLQRDRFIRPLLEIERRDIEDYLAERAVASVIDKSNLKTDFLRNKVRLDLLDSISQIFPGAEDSVIRFNHDFRDTLDHYDRLLEQNCPWTLSPRGETLRCCLKSFEEIPFVSRKRIILKQMNRLQKGLFSSNRRIPASFFLPLEDMRNTIILRGHGISLKKNGADLILALLENNSGSGEDISIFYLDRTHSYETPAYSVKLTCVSELEKDDQILYLLGEEDHSVQVVIRSPLGTSELKRFPVQNNDVRHIVFCKELALCALTSEDVYLPEGAKFKKIDNIDIKNKAQCVIIKFRGRYAPG